MDRGAAEWERGCGWEQEVSDGVGWRKIVLELDSILGGPAKKLIQWKLPGIYGIRLLPTVYVGSEMVISSNQARFQMEVWGHQPPQTKSSIHNIFCTRCAAIKME